jgi:hypothetical protein
MRIVLRFSARNTQSFLCALCVALFFIVQVASAGTLGDLTYSVGTTYVTITDCNSAATVVTIPATIEGKPVTSIGSYAFYENSFLTSVDIPNSVIIIGYSAFSGCRRLASLTIPDSVTTIGSRSFENCDSLVSIAISNNVTMIGEYAFGYSDSLTSFTVDGLNPNYLSVEGVLFNKDQTKLIQYPASRIASAYTVPNTVQSIESFAFYYCSVLTNVMIPSSVTSIGSFSFGYCSVLTSVTIPNSVTSIGPYAFYNCDSLESVMLSSSVKSIQIYTFYRCIALTSIIIPNSVTSIAREAFDGCRNLKSVYFEGNAATLGSMTIGSTGPDFTVYYRSTATGFTTPTWNGYTTAIYLPQTDGFPAATQDPSGWWHQAGFGWFWVYEGSGWIWNWEHGYLWIHPEGDYSGGGIYFWDYNLVSWMWTNSEHYPWIHSWGVGDWLKYELGGTPGNRYFFRNGARTAEGDL